jgi:pimeloyl-ACP methyl ester carboxylesterase
MVLVHGSNHGGWCWRRTLEPLREAGFEVHAPTLTGLGERAHLLTPEVDLDTHIADIVAVIENEELSDVTLVGHSYGALVIVGVAAAMPGRIKRVVLVDGPLVVDGESGASSHPMGHIFVERREVVDGVAIIPQTDGSSLGLDDDDLAWIRRRLTPQPFASVVQPISLPANWGDGVERIFIRCDRGDGSPPAPYISRVDSNDEWVYREILSGHDVMISDAEAFTTMLLELCAADDGGTP